jgi:hypothetical protein
MTTSATNTKKIVLAIAVAPASIPVNPNIPAMIAIIKNITVHFNIQLQFDYLYTAKLLPIIL